MAKADEIRIRGWWIAGYIAFFIVGLIACCYGYAATQKNLLISGEATVQRELNPFGVEYMQDLDVETCARTARMQRRSSKINETARAIGW